MRYLPGPTPNGFAILFGIAGFVGTLLVIALIVALVVYLVRRGKTGPAAGGPTPPAPQALHILDQRLATGEIEIADYLNRRAALLGEAGRPAEWSPSVEETVASPDPEVPPKATK